MPEKALVSLKDHDEKRRKKWAAFMGVVTPNAPTGIACPNCGGELEDGYTIRGWGLEPLAVGIRCPNCDWRGERVR